MHLLLTSKMLQFKSQMLIGVNLLLLKFLLHVV